MESHWLFVKCARALARAGFAALRFDFYGSGESDGDFADASFQGQVRDAISAVDFLRRQRGVNPKRLALIGLSLGGAVAASIARRARVQVLVLWSAVAHPEELGDMLMRAARPIPGRPGFVDYNAHAVSSRFLEKRGKIEPLRRIARFRGPTLVVHAENDDVVPLSHAQDYFTAAGASVKEKVVVPGADHTFAALAWERKVIGGAVAWLQAHLLQQ